jgi:hypothetical protein
MVYIIFTLVTEIFQNILTASKKRFLKATSSHMNGFTKAADIVTFWWIFWKPLIFYQWLLETLL